MSNVVVVSLVEHAASNIDDCAIPMEANFIEQNVGIAIYNVVVVGRRGMLTFKLKPANPFQVLPPQSRAFAEFASAAWSARTSRLAAANAIECTQTHNTAFLPTQKRHFHQSNPMDFQMENIWPVAFRAPFLARLTTAREPTKEWLSGAALALLSRTSHNNSSSDPLQFAHSKLAIGNCSSRLKKRRRRRQASQRESLLGLCGRTSLKLPNWAVKFGGITRFVHKANGSFIHDGQWPFGSAPLLCMLNVPGYLMKRLQQQQPPPPT